MKVNRKRNGVAFASAVAVVVIAVAAVGAYYIIAIPGPSSSNSGPTGTQYRPGLANTTSTQAGGVATSRAPEGWEAGLVAKAALTSPQVLSYIRTAYSYRVVGLSQTSASPIMVSMLLNITGNQIVAGNWTTGYRIAYTRLDVLNVTVQFTYPSNYTVARALPAQLPERNFSLSYDATQ